MSSAHKWINQRLLPQNIVVGSTSWIREINRAGSHDSCMSPMRVHHLVVLLVLHRSNVTAGRTEVKEGRKELPFNGQHRPPAPCTVLGRRVDQKHCSHWPWRTLSPNLLPPSRVLLPAQRPVLHRVQHPAPCWTELLCLQQIMWRYVTHVCFHIQYLTVNLVTVFLFLCTSFFCLLYESTLFTP